MDRRTYEGPMDWEYQGSGALDPTSPFTHAAKGVFASPSKPLSRPNPFANLGTPTKSQLPPPQTSSFTPQLPSRASAPAFRNPAFTTPRKPFDELVLSEASGAEDSPALTEVSDYPNDTPEADRMGDVVMGGTMSPSKIDKSFRYGKAVFPPKKYSSGRGDIRGNRELSAADLLRKRKRHNLDKDVGSVARYRGQGWDSDADSDDSIAPRAQTRSRSKKNNTPSTGVVGSLFHMLDEHPNAPDNLFRWIQLVVNFFLVSIFVYIGWAIVDTVRGDIRSANEAARLELMSKMTECQNQYTMNECSKKDRPALKLICDEWFDCMMQNPEAIMRVKVTAKQIAEIINEFSEAMNLKAWGFFFAILILCAFANNLTLGKIGGDRATPAAPSQSAAIHDPAMPPESGPGFMWVPVQTPRMNRHAMLDEGTDTDSSPPKMKPLLAAPYTPSGRRSPSKKERSLSPVNDMDKVHVDHLTNAPMVLAVERGFSMGAMEGFEKKRLSLGDRGSVLCLRIARCQEMPGDARRCNWGYSAVGARDLVVSNAPNESLRDPFHLSSAASPLATSEAAIPEASPNNTSSGSSSRSSTQLQLPRFALPPSLRSMSGCVAPVAAIADPPRPRPSQAPST
ncbi:hypothetical protein G7Z17_g12387 [Cylindrodendrum hubeiense]|uniref:Brl1/Brr6 domain-containing protein n=1 Tax=Cylindrodendrum hubeiense TaxID=595255 RepID=A0A9P5GXS8_9HYPO|nr:hypothetical protein G7Z17_g12387 [Cylindrodendrum hubeiense]